MSDARFELVRVPSGALSLRSREHGETFHPGIGPIEEARLLHVAQHRFEERLRPGGVIWDVGLGAAANAIALIEALRSNPAEIALRSFDQTLGPLEFALDHAAELKYPAPWVRELGELLASRRVRIGPICWTLDLGDFRDRLHDAAAPMAIMFDPYSPTANPAMWTRDLFRAIRERAGGHCTLTTYSRSTVTRVRLLQAGWCVGRGAPTGEKTETTVAATFPDLLRDPLRRDWLDRVRRSTAPALRESGSSPEEIARSLELCPQMSVQ